ncbi:hypothetical protein EMCRGX_G008987 [Ephydatia muelleri]
MTRAHVKQKYPINMDYLTEKWEALKARHFESLRDSDPRTKDWFLMQSPLAHVGSVRGILRHVRAMVIYNITMVGLSFYLFVEIFLSAQALDYTYICDVVDYEDRSEPAMRMSSVIWLYFLSKIIEFLDTFFFILRKKDDQITFLHVYHHSTMVMIWWMVTKWYGGGNSFFSAMLNSFVHVVMYTYYLLSALGPRVRKYLWWKKYLTGMQLIQFLVMLVHCTHSLLIECGYDRRPQWIYFFYLLSHIALFSNFYRNAYIKPKGTSDGGSDAALQKKARQKKEQ